MKPTLARFSTSHVLNQPKSRKVMTKTQEALIAHVADGTDEHGPFILNYHFVGQPTKSRIVFEPALFINKEDGTHTINVFNHLIRCLKRTEAAEAFERELSELNGAGFSAPKRSWLGGIDEEWELPEGAEFKGAGYTYNDDTDLSRDYQWFRYETDKIRFVAIALHVGADARAGFTGFAVYELTDLDDWYDIKLRWDEFTSELEYVDSHDYLPREAEWNKEKHTWLLGNNTISPSYE